MRTSRVVFTGIAVAAAAVGGTAFTAANSGLPTSTHVGYGETAISGVHVTNVTYTPLAADNTYLDQIVFTTDTDVSASGYVADLILKDGSGVPLTDGNVVCSLGSFTTTMDITCVPRHTGQTGNALYFGFADFDAVGLTVRQ